MPTLAAPDFTSASSVVGGLVTYLRARLVTPVPIPDRATGDDVDGPAVLFGVHRFFGDPTSAVEEGMAQRTDDTVGGKAFACIGYTSSTSVRVATTREPVTQALPLSVLVVLPTRGAQFREADEIALDLAADWALFWLGSRFLNPHSLGLVGLYAEDGDAGDIVGYAAMFRRFTLTAVRSLR